MNLLNGSAFIERQSDPLAVIPIYLRPANSQGWKERCFELDSLNLSEKSILGWMEV